MRSINIKSIVSSKLLVDSAQIEQVMINLIKNADESMALKLENEKDIKEDTGKMAKHRRPRRVFINK